MAKLIQLKVTKIKYGGDFIGKEISLEIQTPNLSKPFILSRKLKKGDEMVSRIKVDEFLASGVTFVLPVSLKIIERDKIFDDVGSKNIEIKIDLNSNLSQINSHEIKVAEIQKIVKRANAIFTIDLEVVVSDPILIVSREGGANGFTNAIPEIVKNDGKEIALPAYLKVRLESEKDNRQYFTILEGVGSGEKASLKIESDETKYLQAENSQIGAVSCIYFLSKKKLEIKAAGTFKKSYKTALPDQKSEWIENGIYDIEIPDTAHDDTYYDAGGNERRYTESGAKLVKVWFRLNKKGRPGHQDKWYLHAGRISAGCVTLVELTKWDELCEILLKARIGDGQSIGTLEVID